MNESSDVASADAGWIGAPGGLVDLLDGLQTDHVAMNRRAVFRAEGIADVIRLARTRPWVYSHGVGKLGAAEGAVVFDIALRLQLNESHVRSLAMAAEVARADLPRLWRRAREGFVAFPVLEIATSAAMSLRAPIGADDATIGAAAAAIRELDSSAEEWALHDSPAMFRSRVRKLVARLTAETAAARHTRAMTERRVIVEPAEDGMAWVSAFVPMIDALAIKRRLTSTAKHTKKDLRENRSRDQIRADLFSAWLTGKGTPAAAKTKVFVTIPVQLLDGSTPVPAEQAQLIGHGPIDPLTAKQIFLDAKAFRRIVTDPIRGVILDMDRRTYRPTRAQRDWLILQHGTCVRDGCTRLAQDSDIDHRVPYRGGHGGATNLSNLGPFCPADHARKHQTTIRYLPRDDGSVQVATPTGWTTSADPPF